ncbi:MAG: ATP-binding protein [Armatimonadetes bacterium]|nr:ATP-binding protein [Armatimonadota bacterium]
MNHPHDVVELRIPRKPEYVGVARLAVSGIASRMDFSYDEVEDIKLAVGEACTSVIHETAPEHVALPIVVRCESAPDEIRIDVVNIRPAPRKTPPREAADAPISQLLMEVLMDEVEVRENEDGSAAVRMVKRVSRDEA